jgi:hypothetical protein
MAWLKGAEMCYIRCWPSESTHAEKIDNLTNYGFRHSIEEAFEEASKSQISNNPSVVSRAREMTGTGKIMAKINIPTNITAEIVIVDEQSAPT